MQVLQSNTLLQGGKYRIERVLGQGGFGITYLAEHTGLCQKIAIKEFFMKEFCERDEDTLHVTIGSTWSREVVMHCKEKFLREARNIAQLDHPNIVRVHDVFKENGTVYYVMEYLRGGTLKDMTDRHPLQEAQAVSLIKKVAQALGYIHEHKMLHLDVKPGNILLRKPEVPVLIDFGISKRYDEEGNATTSTIMGLSQGYAPLELYNQKLQTFSPATDIYSLGATLYNMLTGKTPPYAAEIAEEGVPIRELKEKGISESCIKVIENAMKLRGLRTQSVGEFLDSFNGNESVGKDTEKTIMIAKMDNGDVQNGLDISEMESLKRIKLLASKINKKYDCLYSFHEGLAHVKLDGKWGFIDTNGKEIIPCKYDGVESFHEGLAYVTLNGKYGFIDTKGKEVIPCRYDDAYSYSEGLASVGFNGKWGYIDTKGKEVIPCKYDWGGIFHEGLAFVAIKGGLNLFKCFFGSKFGVINTKGELIVPGKWKGISSFSMGLARVELNQKWGFIDTKGKEIIPYKYDYADEFFEGLAVVRLNGKWGFIDTKGKEVIPCKYDWAYSFSECLARVELNGKWGFIDRKGKEVIPYKYEDDVLYPFSEGLAGVKLNGKWGFIDSKGKEIIPCKYDDISNFHEGLAIVQLNGKYGYIDEYGHCTLDY